MVPGVSICKFCSFLPPIPRVVVANVIEPSKKLKKKKRTFADVATQTEIMDDELLCFESPEEWSWPGVTESWRHNNHLTIEDIFDMFVDEKAYQ